MWQLNEKGEKVFFTEFWIRCRNLKYFKILYPDLIELERSHNEIRIKIE